MDRTEITNGSTLNCNADIRDELRKIVLGHSYQRVKKAPYGMGGVGTTRMVSGFVKKIHDNPSDDEFEEYGGTIDVADYYDPEIVYKGVYIGGLKNQESGFIIVPTLYSDVTILMDAGTENWYVSNYSHADVIRWNAHKSTTVGVTETEEIDIEDANSPDYDELEETGNRAYTTYSVDNIKTEVAGKDGKRVITEITPSSQRTTIGNNELFMDEEKSKISVSDSSITVSEDSVKLGSENATEPAVLGKELAQLMKDFLTECSKITTTTMLGTQPALNIGQFASLITRIDKFLSKQVYVK